MKKTILITGAYGNLGQACVKKFVREGYTAEGTIMPGEPVPAGFPAEGVHCTPVDITNETDAADWVKTAIEKYKTLDAAVLTVGGFAMGTIQDTSIADIQQQYKLNFETAYTVARPVFAQMMRQKKGRIFMIGSRPGLQASFSNGMVAYGLAKSMVIRLAELMNQEAKGVDVVTSIIIPGTIDTPQNRNAMPGSDVANWVKPDAIADTIFFYCTSEATALREPVIKIYGNG